MFVYFRKSTGFRSFLAIMSDSEDELDIGRRDFSKVIEVHSKVRIENAFKFPKHDNCFDSQLLQ